MSGSCVEPRKGWMSREAHPRTGRNLVVFAEKSRGFSADYSRPLWVPCLKCVNCAEVKGSALSIRCFHEFQLSGIGCFGTLTYRDECLPPDLTAALPDARAFMKRLDIKLRRQFGAKWRGVMVGEYGGRFGRPHLHFLLFGADLCLRSDFVETVDGEGRWNSALLNECWPFGGTDVRPMTPGRAAYVGAHCIKNFHVSDAFRLMSRRPGIGYGWLDHYGEQLARDGYVIVGGQKLAVPAEYLAREDFRELLEPVREKRRAFAADQPDFNDPGEFQRRLSKSRNIVSRRTLFNGTL